jgi:hypothetical protein
VSALAGTRTNFLSLQPSFLNPEQIVTIAFHLSKCLDLEILLMPGGLERTEANGTNFSREQDLKSRGSCR